MERLAHAAQAFAEGRNELARQLIRELPQAALREAPVEAEALWLLAQIDTAQGLNEAALANSLRAGALFEAAADRPAQVRAGTAAAYAASLLCENESAIESARAAAALGASLARPDLELAANNTLGFALLWDGDMHSAQHTLSMAIDTGARVLGPRGAIRPLHNLATGEILAQILARIFDDARPDPRELKRILRQRDTLGLSPNITFFSGGFALDVELAGQVLHAWLDCWQGDIRSARERAAESAALLAAAAGAQLTMAPYICLLKQEIALAEHDWPEGLRLCGEGLDAARRVQNRQLEWVGALSRLRVLEAMGRFDEALEGWRLLYRRGPGLQGRTVVGFRGLGKRNGPRKPAAADPPWPTRTAGGRTARIERSLADWRTRHGLSDAELQVLWLLGTGARPTMIAARRRTSVGTVRSQLRSIFDKTGLRSQQLLIAALGQGGMP